MNKIRIVVSELFQSPMQSMSFVNYVSYLNTGGKITAKSLLDLVTVLFTYAEEQEKKNEQYEANFKEIEAILSKLVEQKVDDKTSIKLSETPKDQSKVEFICDICNKTLSTALALSGHKRSHK